MLKLQKLDTNAFVVCCWRTHSEMVLSLSPGGAAGVEHRIHIHRGGSNLEHEAPTLAVRASPSTLLHTLSVQKQVTRAERMEEKSFRLKVRGKEEMTLRFSRKRSKEEEKVW